MKRSSDPEPVASDPSQPAYGTRCVICFGSFFWRVTGSEWTCWGCFRGPDTWQSDLSCQVINTGVDTKREAVAMD